MTLRAYLDASCTQEVGGTPEVGSAYGGFEFQLGLNSDGVIYFRDEPGKRTPQGVWVYPVAGHGPAVYPSDISVSSTAGNYQPASAGANIGIVGGSVAVPCHFMQTVGRQSESARPFFVRAIYGGDSIDLPTFVTTPSVGAIGSTSVTATATGNSVVTAMKYLVLPAASAAPTIADFASASAFTSGATITGLAASTSYKLYVAIWDADGFSAVSSGTPFQTSAAGNSISFTSQPSASAATSQGFTVSYSISDSGSGVGVTHWLSTDSGATFTQVTPSGTYPNYTYAVTGKTSGTHGVQLKVISGATTVVSSVVSMSTGTLAAPSTLSGLATDAAVVLSWSASGGADHYVIRRATNSGMSSNVVTLSTSATGTSYTNNAANGNAPANETNYYYDIQAIDSAGNASATLVSGVLTPGANTFYNNFAAGESLNSTYLDYSVASSGIVNTTQTANVLTIRSAATADAALLRFKNSIDKTKRRRYKIKIRTTAASTNAPAAQLRVLAAHYKTTIPAVWNLSTEPPTTLNFTFDKGSDRVNCSYNSSLTATKVWESTSGAWGDSTNPSTNRPPWTLSTWYYVVFEHDATGFVYEMRDASDALLFRTAKIAWTASYAPTVGANPSPLWFVVGDPYTDYWTATQEVASVRVEALSADIS